MQRSAFITAMAAATLGVGVAACGSTSVSPGVVTAPGGGATVESVAAATSTTATATTSTAATSTVSATTPSSGPLSKEPTISLPKTAAPKTLVVKDLIKGTGATAADGDDLIVNYVGELYSNGKVFDASWKDTPGKGFGPFELGAGAVIPGWDKGLVGMKVGGRRELIIPPSLAYGSNAQSGIPANSTLIFVVDLLKVAQG